MRGRERELKPIQGLFLKYKQRLQAPQTVVVTTFQEIVFDLIAVEIPKEAVSYSVSKRILSVQMSGVVVSEIKMREAEILHHLQGRLGPKNAPKKII